MKVKQVLFLIAITLFFSGCHNPWMEEFRNPQLPQLSGDITITPSGTVDVNTLLTASYSGDEIVDFQWQKDGGNISGANNTTYTPATGGSYTVTVSAPEYISKTSAPVIVPVAVTGITLNKNTTTIGAGNTETLIAVVTPSNATNKTVTWNSNNPAVAAVNNGVVTAVSAGIADITVTTAEGSFSAVCSVSVTLNALTGTVTITGNAVEGQTLTANISALGGSGAISYQWQRDGTDIAGAADNTYILQIDDIGSTITVTVTRAENSGSVTSAPTVTITPALIPVTNITLNGLNTQNDVYELIMTLGDVPVQLNFTVLPANATNKNVKWGSDDFTVAAVSNDGIVTAVSVGTAIISVDSLSTPSVFKFIYVTVTAASVPVTSVSLDQAEMTLTAGGATGTLTAAAAPADAANKTVTWSSSNPAVAAVNNGVVTAVSAGTATIIVTTVDGGHTAACTVTVLQPVTFNITFAQMTDLASTAINVPDPISRTGTGYPITRTLSVTASDYDAGSIKWSIDSGILSQTGGDTFILDAGNNAYNGVGDHFVTLQVTKNGVPYSKTITFKVVQ